MQFFRNFFKSKLGIPVTLAFVALIGFAFAMGDVSNSGSFSILGGGKPIAVVGGEKINAAELLDATDTAVRNVQRQDPTVSRAAFVEQGGLDDVLDSLIERSALTSFASEYGLRAGENLVNSEILSNPAFKGSDGNFDQEAFRQGLASQNLSEARVRAEMAQGLLAKQLLVPAAFGAKVPNSFATQYTALLKETRRGTIAVLPSTAYAPAGEPTAKALNAFYEKQRGDYVRPERRTIRYATFGVDALGNKAEPTEKEIAAYYKDNNKQYAATERRTVTQFIVPTKQAAESIRSKVAGGGSIEQAAKEAGLKTDKAGPLTQEQFAAQTSAAVAKAVFEAGQGTIAVPARSGLGFHVARVDAVEKQAGKTLAQARGEIVEVLRVTKQRNAVTDLAEEIEGQIIDGASITEIAKQVGTEITTTKPLTGGGLVYGAAGEQAPPVLMPALQTAFDMEEGEPELVELQAGQAFLIFEVGEITPSAAAPLKDIRDRVAADWKLAEGGKLARAAADRILARLKGGKDLAAAVREEEKSLPAVDAINLTREQLAQAGGRVPPPLALMFSMAEGTFKKLEAPRNGGWFVVDLDAIQTGEVADDDPLLARTLQELNAVSGQEYASQLRNAIRNEAGVEKNDAGVEAVRKQLVGEAP
ncbi:MAG: SurA N-terminal domain-containing protein [Altererythrobacter sp.]